MFRAIDINNKFQMMTCSVRSLTKKFDLCFEPDCKYRKKTTNAGCNTKLFPPMYVDLHIIVLLSRLKQASRCSVYSVYVIIYNVSLS